MSIEQPQPPATVELVFKDGKVMKWEWREEQYPLVGQHARGTGVEGTGAGKQEKRVKIGDIVEEVNRHERMLERREDLAG